MDPSIVNNGSDPLVLELKNDDNDNNFVDLTVRSFNYRTKDSDQNQQFFQKSASLKIEREYENKREKSFSPQKNFSSNTSPNSKKSFRFRKERYTEPEVLSTTPEMDQLNIPTFLQHVYINGIPEPKITKLRDWQVQLFQRPEWLFPLQNGQPTYDSNIYIESDSFNPDVSQNSESFLQPESNFNTSNIGGSAIVLVPTSGGKTVAADVAIAQLLSSDPTAKAIYALPFVALANEKYSEYTKRFYKFTVRAYYQNVGGPDFRRGSIAICTYEKAHSIINFALIGKYADKIKLVIIDEIHMIGEEHRGAVIEALIVKLLLMRHQPRIIGLTATININDAHLLAHWIRGFAFISDTRPSRVKLFLAKSNGDLHIMNKDGTMNQKITTLVKVGDNNCIGSNTSVEMHFILDPIRRLLSKSPDSTVLIFVNRRADTLYVGDFISKHLYDSRIKNLPQLQQASEDLLDRRRNLVQDLARVSGFVDDSLKRCIINGIGIHHAGLLLEERRLIEAATRNKTISVIIATTTLSAGINIHSVARVFIMNIFRWSPQKGQVPIPNAQFIQMVGRAGRTANRVGEAFVFAHTSMEYEMRTISNLSKQEIANIVPHLKDEGELERFFLQCLSTKLLDPINGLDVFLQMTFNSPQVDTEISATTTTNNSNENSGNFEISSFVKSQKIGIQNNNNNSNNNNNHSVVAASDAEVEFEGGIESSAVVDNCNDNDEEKKFVKGL